VPPSIPVCKDCFHPLSPLSYFGLGLPHRLFPCDNHHCLRCTPFVIRADLCYLLLTSGLPHHVHVAHYGRPTVTACSNHQSGGVFGPPSPSRPPLPYPSLHYVIPPSTDRRQGTGSHHTHQRRPRLPSTRPQKPENPFPTQGSVGRRDQECSHTRGAGPGAEESYLWPTPCSAHLCVCPHCCSG
jgi:hypothetical protein